MHFSNLAVSALSLLAMHASAKTVQIAVGKDGLQFTPNVITADKGDILEYHFFGRHSVAQGDFNAGCTPAAQGGFFSGVMNATTPPPSPRVFRILINDTNPISFYCTVMQHCPKGMVGVINPSSTDSLDKVRKLAAVAKNNTAPAVAGVGGTIVEIAGNNTSTVGPGQTASPTSGSQSSGVASGSPPMKTAAASQVQATWGGMGMLAAAFAALLM